MPVIEEQRFPLTELTEEETLFQQTVASFADDAIRPHVRRMDEESAFDSGIIKQFFQLGLMGIEIEEALGGSGSSFFMAILAIEELSRVDASAGVIVDVQNTLVNNAILRWGSEEQQKNYLPRLASDWVGAYALSEADSGSDAFSLRARAQLRKDKFVLNGRKLWTTNGAEAARGP